MYMHGWLDCRGKLIKDGGPIDRQLVFGGDPDGHASLEAHGGEVDDVVLLGHPPASTFQSNVIFIVMSGNKR